MKYKLKLNSLQKKLLNKWNDHYRFTYNRTIDIINSQNDKISDFSWLKDYGKIESKSSHSNNYSKYELRNMITSEKSNPFSQWVLETPFQLRAYSVFEAYNRYKTCLTNIKKNNITHFNLGFKTKKSLRWTMDFPKDNIHLEDYSKDSFRLYSSGLIKLKEKFKNDIKGCDAKIHFDGKNYFLISPYTKKITKIENRSSICSLDPGTRKFQTIYDPENSSIINIADRASSKLYPLMIKLDKIISKKPKNFKEKKIKILNRIKNLQQELHRKSCKYLCENFETILIPKLNKKNDIIKLENRTISSKTVRNMVVLGHCKFVEMLKTKANQYSNTKVIIVTEEYTSQACLKCHRMTKYQPEIFKCKYCKMKIDRDILGSVNIFYKYLKIGAFE